MADKPPTPRSPPAPAPSDPPAPPPPRRFDPAADADSPFAVPVYPPAQGDGS
jgi:hypothetical protein